VKVKCALVGDDGSLGADREPLRSYLLVTRAGIVAQPIQAAANVLVSSRAHVMGEQLRAEAGFARLLVDRAQATGGNPPNKCVGYLLRSS